MTRVFVATPDRNYREHDFTGAFRPESDALVSAHGAEGSEVVRVNINEDRGARRAQVLAGLRQGNVQAFDLVALLCHGWKGGIQLGFLLEHVQELAAGIASVTRRGAAVVLYACSAASPEFEAAGGTCAGPESRGTQGFADVLWTALSCCTLQDGAPGSSLHLDAHDRAGHTTSNPFVRRFDAEGEAWLIEPGSALWGPWYRELHDRHTSALRLRYPTMTRKEIGDYLRCHQDVTQR